MPVTVVSARICQRGPKRGSEATEQWEVFFFPPTVGRFFENSCMKTALSCTLNAIIIGGRLFNISCTPIKGAGAWTLVPLSYASDSGATRICHREAKARERSDQAGGGYGRRVSLLPR